MSEIGHQVTAPAAAAQDPAALWSEHIQGAVSEFLKTAVVIDNQPWVREQLPASETPELPPEDNGLDEGFPALEPPVSIAEEHSHNLDVRAVSDVFASKGIACAFVLPDDEDTRQDEKIARAVSAAKVSDLVIIDWYLKRKDESLTLQILQQIALSDSDENGRLRLICIYTGEPLKNSIFNDVKTFLQHGGVSVVDVEEIPFCAVGDHTIVVIKNKSATSAQELPSELLSLFSRFADGLVPAFSLAAVGAIRKNAHHMLTRFGKLLDPAYIANRLITNPSSDVSEMLRDLFVAECDSALGLESVADRYLESAPIVKWLEANEASIAIQQVGAVTINKPLLLNVLKGGVKDGKYFKGDPVDIKLHEKDRHKISTALAGSTEASKLSEHEFARLVVLKREAHGRSNLHGTGGWQPSLTTGTLLKYQLKSEGIDYDGSKIPAVFEYIICLTPACDTLRLQGPTPFVFLRAQIDSEKYGVVLRQPDGQELLLQIDQKSPVLRTFFFSPDSTLQRVLASRNGQYGHDFEFKDSEGRKFSWLGEVRYTRASSEMAGLVSNWMRIGISDSEYLRMMSAGRFAF